MSDPTTLAKFIALRDAYLQKRDELIAQTNAVTGKVDLLNALIAEDQPKDSAPNKP